MYTYTVDNRYVLFVFMALYFIFPFNIKTLTMLSGM